MKYILPKRVLCEQGNITNSQKLLNSDRYQIILSEPSLMQVDGKASFILDFGQENYGGIRIQTNTISDNVKCMVRVRFGESLTECCTEITENDGLKSHSVKDLIIELVYSADFVFGNTGFRFVRFDFLTDNCKIGVKNIYASSYIYQNNNVLYSYNGIDERIKDIYKTAKRTVDLCAQGEFIWDGIKRDNIVWIGDMYPEMIAMTTLYGRTDVIENSLDFVVSTTPSGMWMNNFPTYSLWYLIILCDYVKETGNWEFFKRHMQSVCGVVKQMEECVLINGELNYPDYFVDWPTHQTEDEKTGVRAINIMACKRLIETFAIIEEDYSTVKEILNRLMLKPIEIKEKKQIIALKYFALGEISDKEKSLLLSGGVKGFSTFMSYFLFKTVAETESPDKAIEMLKEYYGAMLDKGATTFWEDFDIDWVENSCRIDEFPKDGQKDIHGDFGKHCYIGFRHSLCHAWSCGIIKFIKEYC